mmetsp:Transcript_58413/g.136726  ORF Transcript_58413/g.136726 Transcript_58413/m.136726 type:complete len:253 (+) Transcript_58413:1059-1817(+)
MSDEEVAFQTLRVLHQRPGWVASGSSHRLDILHVDRVHRRTDDHVAGVKGILAVGLDHSLCDGMTHKAAKLLQVIKRHAPKMFFHCLMKLPPVMHDGVLFKGQVFRRQGLETSRIPDEGSTNCKPNDAGGQHREGEDHHYPFFPAAAAISLAWTASELIAALRGGIPPLLPDRIEALETFTWIGSSSGNAVVNMIRAGFGRFGCPVWTDRCARSLEEQGREAKEKPQGQPRPSARHLLSDERRTQRLQNPQS